MERSKWRSDDCVTHALPTLRRWRAPLILLAKTEAAGALRAIKRYGSLRAAWHRGLEHCGYQKVSFPLQREDRVLGRDLIWGWTIGVYRNGNVWVRTPTGLNRARWVRTPQPYRRMV